MFAPYGNENVVVWPVGINTDEWAPVVSDKKYDILLYNKIRWNKVAMQQNLTAPIMAELDKRKITYTVIDYGQYKPEELKQKIAESRFAIFLCEHETQGLAYQQMLSSGLPILAWDRGGYWQDPDWYPEKVKFQPVSSVPYWDERCGIKFTSIDDFSTNLTTFLNLAASGFFKPRDYILQNLTLEKQSAEYYAIISSITHING